MTAAKVLTALAILTIAVVVLPSTALAHAGYDHSTPAKSEYLDKAPAAVDIWFQTPLSERDNQDLTLKDDQGKVVTKASVAVDAKDPTHVRLPLPAGVGNGRYTVSWHLVAGDFMFAEGSFRFYVGVKPTQAQLDDDARLPERMAIPRDSGSSKMPLFAAIGGGAVVLLLGLSFVFWRSRSAY